MECCDYAKPTNQLRPDQLDYLKSSNGMKLLNKVTHIMDAEFFSIDGCQYLCEMSIYDRAALAVECFPVYTTELGDYKDLTWRRRRAINYQRRFFHGLNYVSKPRDGYFLDAEVFEKISTIGFSEDVVVGYKGGNYEKDICEYYNIPHMNLENFNFAKYEQLCDENDFLPKFCRFHRVYDSVPHCSKYETILFMWYLMKKVGDPFYKIVQKQYYKE